MRLFYVCVITIMVIAYILVSCITEDKKKPEPLPPIPPPPIPFGEKPPSNEIPQPTPVPLGDRPQPIPMGTLTDTRESYNRFDPAYWGGGALWSGHSPEFGWT